MPQRLCDPCRAKLHHRCTGVIQHSNGDRFLCDCSCQMEEPLNPDDIVYAQDPMTIGDYKLLAAIRDAGSFSDGGVQFLRLIGQMIEKRTNLTGEQIDDLPLADAVIILQNIITDFNKQINPLEELGKVFEKPLDPELPG